MSSPATVDPRTLALEPDSAVAFANETHLLALELWRYVFPPWRWPQWFARRREIRARIATVRAANEIMREQLEQQRTRLTA